MSRCRVKKTQACIRGRKLNGVAARSGGLGRLRRSDLTRALGNTSKRESVCAHGLYLVALALLSVREQLVRFGFAVFGSASVLDLAVK